MPLLSQLYVHCWIQLPNRPRVTLELLTETCQVVGIFFSQILLEAMLWKSWRQISSAAVTIDLTCEWSFDILQNKMLRQWEMQISMLLQPVCTIILWNGFVMNWSTFMSISIWALQEAPVIAQLMERFNKVGSLGRVSSLLTWAENFFPLRLFPLREHGMNWRAKPLTLQEIEVFKAF